MSTVPDAPFRFDADAPRVRISNQAIIESLRRFGESLGGRAFFMREYDAWPERVIAAETIVRRLGGWSGALARAGIKGGRSKQYTPEELMNNLEAVWRKVGRPPGSDILVSHGRIGYRSYIRVYGSVRNACELLADFHAGRISRERLLRPGPADRKPYRNKRTAISTALRWQVLQRDRYRCTLCGQNPAADPKVQLHIDHITPVSKGGDNSLSNLRVLCRECNEGKSDELPPLTPQTSEPRPSGSGPAR